MCITICTGDAGVTFANNTPSKHGIPHTHGVSKAHSAPPKRRSALSSRNTSPSTTPAEPMTPPISDVKITAVADIHSKQSFYNFDVDTLVCHIQDYEHNHFTVDLKNPLTPMLDLAGELAGLKPSAVTDSPIEPKL